MDILPKELFHEIANYLDVSDICKLEKLIGEINSTYFWENYYKYNNVKTVKPLSISEHYKNVHKRNMLNKHIRRIYNSNNPDVIFADPKIFANMNNDILDTFKICELTSALYEISRGPYALRLQIKKNAATVYIDGDAAVDFNNKYKDRLEHPIIKKYGYSEKDFVGDIVIFDQVNLKPGDSYRLIQDVLYYLS